MDLSLNLIKKYLATNTVFAINSSPYW
jgi:hypothetical protein